MSENIVISHRFSTRIKDSQKNFITKIKKLNNEKNLNEKNFNEWAYTYLINNNSEFSDIDYYPVNKKERSDLIIYFLDYLSCFKEKDYQYKELKEKVKNMLIKNEYFIANLLNGNEKDIYLIKINKACSGFNFILLRIT